MGNYLLLYVRVAETGLRPLMVKNWKRLPRPSCVLFALIILTIGTVVLSGCSIERRKSDAELGLTPQQATGRHVFDNYCGRCHEAYSSKDLQGPTLKGLFRKPYMPSGIPANDDPVPDDVRIGRGTIAGV